MLRAAGRTEHPQRRVAVVGLVAGGLPRQTSRGGATRSDREGKARHWRGTGRTEVPARAVAQGYSRALKGYTRGWVLEGYYAYGTQRGFGTFVGWKFCPVPSPQPGVTVLPPR